VVQAEGDHDRHRASLLCIAAEARGYFDSDHEFFAGCFADLIALLVAQVVNRRRTVNEKPAASDRGQTVDPKVAYDRARVEARRADLNSRDGGDARRQAVIKRLGLRRAAC